MTTALHLINNPGGRIRSARLLTILIAITAAACSGTSPTTSESSGLKPRMIPHSAWEVHPPLGHDAAATRRNLAPGDTLSFEGIRVVLLEATPAADESARDSLTLELTADEASEKITIAEGSARLWEEFRLAVVAAHLKEGELGYGLSELELAVASTVPRELQQSTTAGDASARLRVPHDLTRITLHHSGSEEPLTPDDDPEQKLRDLQTWSESERGWWDVPYHFLIDLDGTIYEGRSYRYMGETNTRYNPKGHLLISVLGNYSLQEPRPAQISAIADLMAWAVHDFNIPVDQIYGHGDLAATECPGTHLRAYLDDGTFRRLVRERLQTAARD